MIWLQTIWQILWRILTEWLFMMLLPYSTLLLVPWELSWFRRPMSLVRHMSSDFWRQITFATTQFSSKSMKKYSKTLTHSWNKTETLSSTKTPYWDYSLVYPSESNTADIVLLKSKSLSIFWVIGLKSSLKLKRKNKIKSCSMTVYKISWKTNTICNKTSNGWLAFCCKEERLGYVTYSYCITTE